MDRISPSSFLDRVPQRIATNFPDERERESFFYTLDFRRYAKQICEKGYICIHIYLYIVCDFFRIVCEQREKSYRVCRFPVAFVPNFSFFFAFPFFLFYTPSLECPWAFFSAKTSMYLLAINASSRSSSLWESSKITGDERTGRPERNKNWEWRVKSKRYKIASMRKEDEYERKTNWWITIERC